MSGLAAVELRHVFATDPERSGPRDGVDLRRTAPETNT